MEKKRKQNARLILQRPTLSAFDLLPSTLAAQPPLKQFANVEVLSVNKREIGLAERVASYTALNVGLFMKITVEENSDFFLLKKKSGALSKMKVEAFKMYPLTHVTAGSEIFPSAGGALTGLMAACVAPSSKGLTCYFGLGDERSQ